MPITFGNTDEEIETHYTIGANQSEGRRYTAPETGNLASISFFGGKTPGGNTNFKALLFDTNYNLLAVGESAPVVNLSSSWVTSIFLDPPLVEIGNDYYLGIMAGPSLDMCVNFNSNVSLPGYWTLIDFYSLDINYFGYYEDQWEFSIYATYKEEGGLPSLGAALLGQLI